MRLIDAETFIESLGLDVENAREDNIGEIVTLEDFDRQATAFDKEKVMDELQNAADLNIGDGLWHVELRDALEIVEKGGIE